MQAGGVRGRPGRLREGTQCRPEARSTRRGRGSPGRARASALREGEPLEGPVQKKAPLPLASCQDHPGCWAERGLEGDERRSKSRLGQEVTVTVLSGPVAVAGIEWGICQLGAYFASGAGQDWWRD